MENKNLIESIERRFMVCRKTNARFYAPHRRLKSKKRRKQTLINSLWHNLFKNQ